MALHHSFSGTKVLVTGGAQGIGRQLVQRFHDDGAKVFTVDKNPETIAELKKALPNVTATVLDLSDWDATRKVIESFGVIDHLVNNAGMMIPEEFLNISQESFSKQFNVNLAATINISQVVAKGLIGAGRGGSIVNLGSIGARVGSETRSAYHATKAGVENLTKSMAIELGQHNIRVNAISPGSVDTPLLQQVVQDDPQFIEEVQKRMIIKRFITTNEIADLVMFLLSPLSTMIVGESVLIEAGVLKS